MLRIYISSHCRGGSRAVELAERVLSKRPALPLALVDIDLPGIDVPRQVIGTPIYIWEDQVLFMGNPSEEELLERLDGIPFNRY